MSENRPSDCSHCSKPSTIYLTQIVDGEVKKQNLCQNCPHAAKATSADSVDIVEPSKEAPKPIVHGIRSIGDGLACPQCGFKQETFKEFGRLGCPSCYDVFGDQLQSVFQKAHKGVTHRGKRPAKYAHLVSQEEIDALKEELQAHVAKEEYEAAAALRDRIWELEGKIVDD